ncbi:Hypothetical predicted protein [Pelobates cultripes]|uniref:Uncharacterized protein n=1 Tax=Pelobates cultripes TaxID=61616 RepID=A0AAD1RFT5_PELCU|nr:Hypothetical predicted protein [Pelobates cultripes]
MSRSMQSFCNGCNVHLPITVIHSGPFAGPKVVSAEFSGMTPVSTLNSPHPRHKALAKSKHFSKQLEMESTPPVTNGPPSIPPCINDPLFRPWVGRSTQGALSERLPYGLQERGSDLVDTEYYAVEGMLNGCSCC